MYLSLSIYNFAIQYHFFATFDFRDVKTTQLHISDHTQHLYVGKRHTMNHTIIPFDETFILYDPTDPLSLISALLALTPILVLQTYLSWLIITRDIESILVTLGQLTNELINKILKRLIKQQRPLVPVNINLNMDIINMDVSIVTDDNLNKLVYSLGPGFGMPSAHSQFLGFTLSFFTCQIWFNGVGQSKSHKFLYQLTFLVLNFAVCASRIYLLYHDWYQVIVGNLIGVAIGLLFYVFNNFLHACGFVDYILRKVPSFIQLNNMWSDRNHNLTQTYRKYKSD